MSGCGDSLNCPSDCPECKWQPVAEITFSPEAGKQVLTDEHGLEDMIRLMLRGGA